VNTLKLLLYVLALVLFLVAAYPPASARANLIALGLAAWVATFLVPG
jgi:hypothetical protein